MNEIGLAYIAGFFDGDGCVTIIRHKNKLSSGGYAYYLKVEIAQKIMLYLFEELLETYGGKIRQTKQPAHFWGILGDKAVTFLQDILPYLRIKQREAKVGIEFQARIKHDGRPLSDFEITEREKLYWKMRELKQRKNQT